MTRCFPLLACLLLSPTLTLAQDLPRPSFLGESLFANRQSIDSLAPSSYEREQRQAASQELWRRVLIDHQLFDASSSNSVNIYAGCRYDTALQVLQQLRAELGPGTAYETHWMANQQRVLKACGGWSKEDEKPVQYTGADASSRAASDYGYQLAAWTFYRGDFVEARKLFDEQAQRPGVSMQAYARYMTLRSLGRSGEVQQAYEEAERLENDPTFKALQPLASELRFILTNPSSPYSRDWAAESVEASEHHLRWLAGLLRGSPEKSADVSRSVAQYQSALLQMRGYLNPWGPTDWWWNERSTSNTRYEALRNVARDDVLIDWMHADQAYNIFDIDWLWALHQPESRYWEHNRQLVAHALERWRNGDGAEWLAIALSRVHPQDPQADELLAQAAPYLERAWEGETPEYLQWLRQLWLHSVRVTLANQGVEPTLALFDAHQDLGGMHPRNSYQDGDPRPGAYAQALRWLMYQGRQDEARQVLASGLTTLREEGFNHWRLLLAETWDQAYNAGVYPTRYSGPPPLWERMLDLLPASTLHQVAQEERLGAEVRLLLSRTALTRAMLLDDPAERVDTYALDLSKRDPDMRDLLLRKTAAHRRDDYIDLLLQAPRLRITPNLSLLSHRFRSEDVQDRWSRIDPYNHNDNNWWCSLNIGAQEQQVMEAATLRPVEVSLRAPFESLRDDEQSQAFIAKQQALFRQHPFWQALDRGELERLAAIPAAPRYLSEAVASREYLGRLTRFAFWRGGEDVDERAANLNHAIRTTRYGCQRDGSHEAYSKRAFQLLHQGYRDNLWAKATPYWFGCSHFRGGCPKPPEESASP